VQLSLRIGDEKVNCRFGPGVVYAFVNELEAGTPARAIGRNEDSTWWYIRDPGNPGGTCWVSAQVTQIKGDAESLPVIAPPPVTVTKIDLRIEPLKIFVSCNQFPQTVFFEAQIATNGPARAVWRLEASTGYISAENILTFEESGMKVVNGYYQVPVAGDYWLKLHILKPNDTLAQLNFPANCTP
jgi:SH3-like domain-containing protein